MTQDINLTKNIILFEDSPEDASLVRRALSQAGVHFALSVIDNGAEALAFVQEKSARAPDLLILDLNMPKHDGFEILEAMRGNVLFAAVPVAVFSSSVSSRDKTRARQFDVTQFVSKPSELKEFLQAGLVFKALLEKTDPAQAVSA